MVSKISKPLKIRGKKQVVGSYRADTSATGSQALKRAKKAADVVPHQRLSTLEGLPTEVLELIFDSVTSPLSIFQASRYLGARFSHDHTYARSFNNIVHTFSFLGWLSTKSMKLMRARQADEGSYWIQGKRGHKYSYRRSEHEWDSRVSEDEHQRIRKEITSCRWFTYERLERYRRHVVSQERQILREIWNRHGSSNVNYIAPQTLDLDLSSWLIPGGLLRVPKTKHTPFPGSQIQLLTLLSRLGAKVDWYSSVDGEAAEELLWHAVSHCQHDLVALLMRPTFGLVLDAELLLRLHRNEYFDPAIVKILYASACVARVSVIEDSRLVHAFNQTGPEWRDRFKSTSVPPTRWDENGIPEGEELKALQLSLGSTRDARWATPDFSSYLRYTGSQFMTEVVYDTLMHRKLLWW